MTTHILVSYYIVKIVPHTQWHIYYLITLEVRNPHVKVLTG